MSVINVTIWNEGRHEKTSEEVRAVYPEGIHGAIAQYLKGRPGMVVKTATLDDPGQGLPDEVLGSTDVLLWWAHTAHGEVEDALVDRIQQRILVDGMGLIVLHSGHLSKVFQRMMGTSCCLKWREVGERQLMWVVNPYHPITRGVEDGLIEFEHCEMYGEPFDVPTPDDTLFISWYEGGEVFRSGMTWHRGRGKVVYLQAGHETFPIYKNGAYLGVIENAVRWCKFDGNTETTGIGSCTHMGFTLNPIRGNG
ncbi:MAG: ThuA domain-containing protein [Promethearchaeota archaeon]